MINGGTTSNALLGLLSMEPMSGYDMRQLISESIGYFWSESYGQIYPALRRLAAEGLVAKKTERTKGKPDRHVYSLTAAGRKQLRGWLSTPVAETVARDELLLKMFFGAHAAAGVNREHVRESMAKHEAALKTYAAMAKQLRGEHAGDPQLPFWLMTLNRGRHDSMAAVKWCRETLEELGRLELKGKS